MLRPRSPAPASSSASAPKALCSVDRGYVRPEDEAPTVEPEHATDGESRGTSDDGSEPTKPTVHRAVDHHRRPGGRAGGRRGRRRQAAARPVGDGADRPSHAGAARRRGEQSARRHDGAASQARRRHLSADVVDRWVPGSHCPARLLQRSARRPEGQPVRQVGRRSARSVEDGHARRTSRRCGTGSPHSTMRAAWRCWRIASATA